MGSIVDGKIRTPVTLNQFVEAVIRREAISGAKTLFDMKGRTRIRNTRNGTTAGF